MRILEHNKAQQEAHCTENKGGYGHRGDLLHASQLAGRSPPIQQHSLSPVVASCPIWCLELATECMMHSLPSLLAQANHNLVTAYLPIYVAR